MHMVSFVLLSVYKLILMDKKIEVSYKEIIGSDKNETHGNGTS